MTVNYIRVADTVLLSNGDYMQKQGDTLYTLDNDYVCITSENPIKLEVIITEQIAEVGDRYQDILNAMPTIRKIVGNYKGIESRLDLFEANLRKEVRERLEFKAYLAKVEEVYAKYPQVSIELKNKVTHFDWARAYESYDDRLTASHAAKKLALNKELDAVVGGQEYAKAIRAISK